MPRLKPQNLQAPASPPFRLHKPLKGIAVVKVLMIVLLLVVVGGLGFVATQEIPAPLEPVELVIPDSRFQR